MFITLTHYRLCAMLMYAMWWRKPLLAKEPILLDPRTVKELFAYMYICSEISGQDNLSDIQDQTLVKRLFVSLNIYSRTPEAADACLVPEDGHDPDAAASDGDTLTRRFTSSSSGCEEIHRKLEHSATGNLAFFERRPRVNGSTANSASLGEVKSRAARLCLASQAVAKFPNLLSPERMTANSGRCMHIKSQEYIVNRAKNWPSDDLLRNVSGLAAGMILWFSNFAYGGLHAAAWNDHFPSVAEKWLWRGSSLYIAFCGGFWIILNYAVQAYQPLNDFWEKWMDGKKSGWHSIVLVPPVLICGLSFILARLYIVLEAFMSIRQLPAAAYDTPSWSQVFPHF
jgi:hypothetical protein